jgi:hypothetical protein
MSSRTRPSRSNANTRWAPAAAFASVNSRESDRQVREPSPLSSPSAIDSNRSAETWDEMVAAIDDSEAPSSASSRLRLNW